MADVLCLLCISHCGLAEDELLQLLDMLGYRNHQKVTAVHWAAFRNATKHWIQEKPSGLLYFGHQSLRNAVEHKLLGEQLGLCKGFRVQGRKWKGQRVWGHSSRNE